MLYLSAKSDTVDFNRIVFAQDTGGAIKSEVRADMFLGFGENAGKIAGELKAPLHLWIFKPKKRED
jgi:membrane-bound lytic murein transglycosylase A